MGNGAEFSGFAQCNCLIVPRLELLSVLWPLITISCLSFNSNGMEGEFSGFFFCQAPIQQVKCPKSVPCALLLAMIRQNQT
ncbi:hypothetical protein XENTR_v10017206 [Xenopus tropicalis]|nr:hypothetical protein XENTR_v10017206 [Xenopus tropicalis]